MFGLLEQRCQDEHQAWLAFGLVAAATNAAIRTQNSGHTTDLHARLLAEIEAMQAILTS